MGRTMTLEEVENRTVSDLLRQAAREPEPVTIFLGEGTAITLSADHTPEPPEVNEKLELKPLVTLDGYIPDGWKDAIYDDYH